MPKDYVSASPPHLNYISRSPYSWVGGLWWCSGLAHTRLSHKPSFPLPSMTPGRPLLKMVTLQDGGIKDTWLRYSGRGMEEGSPREPPNKEHSLWTWSKWKINFMSSHGDLELFVMQQAPCWGRYISILMAGSANHLGGPGKWVYCEVRKIQDWMELWPNARTAWLLGLLDCYSLSMQK